MKLTEALASTAPINIGVEARNVRRKDRRGRIWYLISARQKLFLVRQDKSGYKEVTSQFAAQWHDWVPQSSEDAAREMQQLDTPSGRRFRNILLGLVMGPLPERLTAPEGVPEDL